jgi:hypothetical protein
MPQLSMPVSCRSARGNALRALLSRTARPLAAAGLVLVTACSVPDYSPVRDWAATASRAADYSTVGLRCVPRAEQPAAGPDQLQDGILAMQHVVSTYLSALVTLASDGLLTYRQDPFAELAPRIRAVSEAGGTAAAALGAVLHHATIDGDQAPDLDDTIVASDAPFQVLVTALSDAVARAGLGEADARGQAAAAYAQLASGVPEGATRQAARDAAALRDREFAAAAAARANYIALLRRIGEGHALLKERAPRLAQEETARHVRASDDQVQRAAALLPRGLLSLQGSLACAEPPPVVGIPPSTRR